ncbi:hypothetical protein BH11GEM2_BH11GEM2_11990 [soil metagenome]
MDSLPGTRVAQQGVEPADACIINVEASDDVRASYVAQTILGNFAVCATANQNRALLPKTGKPRTRERPGLFSYRCAVQR